VKAPAGRRGRPAADAAVGDPCAPDRQRVERGIYRQRNGNYAVCVVQARRVLFRTIGPGLAAARVARHELAAAALRRELPLSPRTLFKTVAARWLEGFETKLAAGERRQSTLDACGTATWTSQSAAENARASSRLNVEMPPWRDCHSLPTRRIRGRAGCRCGRTSGG